MLGGTSPLAGAPLGDGGDVSPGPAGGSGTLSAVAARTRTRGAVSTASAIAPPTLPLLPPSNISAWQAMWDAVPLGSPSGWLAGDGCWSVLHPGGAAALFSFGDTPVLTSAGPIAPTGVTATGQGSAISGSYVIVTDGAAAPFAIGDRVQVYLADGVTLRDTGVFTIASKPSSSGYTNLTFDWPMTSGSVAGDIVRVVTGGQSRTFPNSSAVLWTNTGLRLVSGPGNFVPNDGDTSWHWAGPMIIDTDNAMYVFASKQGPPPTPNPNNLPWSTLGQSLHKYTWTNPAAAPVWQNKVADIAAGIQWGAAMVRVGSYTYIYGSYRAPEAYGNRLFVARIANGSLGNSPTTWEFWVTAGGGTWATGSGNLTSITNLKEVLSDTPGLENSISANYYASQVRIVSKSGGVFGSDITVWESSSVTGPWTTRAIGSAPYRSPTAADQTYITLGHYDLPLLPDGNMLVSTSRNQSGRTLGDYFDNPTWYRPKWFEANPAGGSGAIVASAVATRRRGGTAAASSNYTPPATPVGIPVICELFVDGAWQDLTGVQTYYRRLVLDQGVSITRGQSGEQSAQAVASVATARLRNPDGFLSPRNPQSGWYGKIGRNTQIRYAIASPTSWLQIPGPTLTGYYLNQQVTCPDSAGLSITGDIDLRFDADMDTWSETAHLISKWAGGAYAYALVLDAGTPVLVTSSNGSATLSHRCPYALPVTRGRMSLRVTLQVNNGGGGRTVTWYTAPSLGGTYTALGSGVTYSGTTSIADTTAQVTIGANGGYGITPQGTIRARILGAQILQGIGGTLRGSPDFTGAVTGAANVIDGQGNTWTVFGSAALTTKDIRFHGEVSSWQLNWSGRSPTVGDLAVDVEAAGILRRLGQGSATTKSALARKLSSAHGAFGGDIVQYWPCEDGQDVGDALSSGLDDYPPMMVSGADTAYATYSGIPGSLPLPTLGLKATWQGQIPTYPASSEFSLLCFMNLPTKNLAEQNIISANMAGTLGRIGVHTDKNGNLLVIRVSAGNVQTTYGPYGFSIGGRKLRVQLDLAMVGSSTVSFALTVANIDGTNGAYITDTISGAAFTAASGIVVSNGAALDQLSIGHIACANSRIAFYELGFAVNAANGYRTEPAGRRIQRLCQEEGVPFRILGDLDDTVETGFQTADSPVAAMQAAADADGGILTESRDDLSLMFVPRSSMQSQDAALSLPYARLASLVPVEDDRWTRNDITVSRPGAGARRRTLDVGRLSIQPPPLGVGRYDDSVELNLAYDRQLKFHTGWLLAQGTVDEPRYPTIDLQLAHPTLTTAQREAMRRLDIGQRLAVTGTPLWLDPNPISQLAVGFTETIGNATHSITANCVPEKPYRIAEYSATSRYSADSYLAVGDYNSTTTGFYVNTPDGTVWTTGADLPFDLLIAGERVTVTGIGAPSGTVQIFTVTRSVNGVVKNQLNGTQIQLVDAAAYSL